VLNPYKLWWLVILISSLSLIGYTAVRWLGEQRGLALTGFFGGLVSSTAVTLSFARQSRVTPSADMLTVGILLAWTIMFFRVIVEVAVVHAPLLRAVAPLMALLGACCLLVTGVLYWRSRARAVEDSPTVALTNPFSLWEAIKFGLFFAGVLLLVELSQRYLPASMIYGVAALAGTTDVDAITLSLAEEVRAGALEDTVAAQAIIIAALSNTLVKCGMVVALGSRPLGVRVSIASGVMVVAGVLALWVQAGL